MSWWRVETHYAVGAVRTEQGRIAEAPPIFRRWLGRELWKLEAFRNAKITAMHDKPAD